MKHKTYKVTPAGAVSAQRFGGVLPTLKSIAQQLPAAARQGEHAASGKVVVQMHADVWRKRMQWTPVVA